MLRVLKWAAALVFAAALCAAGALWWYVKDSVLPFPQDKETAVLTVKSGESLRRIVANIRALGIDVNADIAAVYFRYKKIDRSIHAGRYALNKGLTLEALGEKLASGDILMGKATLVEGNRSEALFAQIRSNPDVETVSDAMSDEEINKAVGLEPGMSLEGWIAPDTYVFAAGDKDIRVLKRACDEQKKRLKQVWEARDKSLTLKNPYELLIFASLIEKETGVEEDRKLVSSVFHNRLSKGMMLQTDPSVIYGIKDFDGVIRRSHLKTDTPYNTYTRKGLPPTPITNPSLKSLQAAANPDKTDYLYFVAKGEGKSHFSKSLREHNAAVHKYLRSQGK